MAVQDWNSNPDLNTSVEGENVAEGSTPPSLNDTFRKVAAAIKNFWSSSYGSAANGGGKRIYIQAAGDPAPATPVESDIWIEYTP